MKHPAALLSVLALVSGNAVAAPINLKCSFEDSADGSRSDSWITVDVEASYMRTDGEALPLHVTNNVYSSGSRVVAGFKTFRTINRETGAITVTELYGADVVRKSIGECEKMELPKKKF